MVNKKNTKVSKKNTKVNSLRKSKKTNTKTKNPAKVLFNIKLISKLYKDNYDELEKGGIEKWRQLKDKFETYEFSEDQEKIANMVSDFLARQKFTLTRSEMSDIATEFIPTNKKDKNSCLMEYKEIEEKKFNFIHEWEESYKSKIYYAKKGDHKYVIKVKNLDPMTEWNKKRLTKEINLSKLTSEKGLSPKIHNVFFCKNEKGKDRLFIVMDKINGGDLGEYLKENKLSEKEKEMIKDLINKLFENDIYLNYLSKDNILVELDDKKKIKKLYLAGLGNLSSAEDLRKEKKELLMEDIEFLSDITENSKIDLCVKDLVYRKIIDIVN